MAPDGVAPAMAFPGALPDIFLIDPDAEAGAFGNGDEASLIMEDQAAKEKGFTLVKDEFLGIGRRSSVRRNAKNQRFQSRFALPDSSFVRSSSLAPASSVCVAATQVARPPPSVQTGQSLPQTTRSQPKPEIVCST